MAINKAALKKRHGEYEANKGLWDFFWESYEGGSGYIEGGNLIRHPREDTTVYNRRKERAYFVNYCGAIIDTYIAHLNKQAPVVDVPKPAGAWAAFAKDVNRRSDSLSEFRREVQAAAMTLGQTFIVVDKPDSGALSLAEEIESGTPFFMHYYPWDVVDWDLDEFGKPYWVKLLETDRSVPSSPFQKGRGSRTLYKIWFRDSWTMIDSDGKVVNSGENPLGEVPIVPVLNRKKKSNPMQGISALNDIAYLNKRIFNLGSLIDQFAFNAAFPMLRNPQVPGGESGDVSVSERTVFEFPDTASYPPEWMSPPTEPLKFLSEEIASTVKEIQRLARLEAGFDLKQSQPQSGVSKAFDWLSTSTVLAEKADNFEEAERNAVRLWLKWQGMSDAIFTVDYPDEFDMKSLEKEIEDAVKLKSLQISPTFEAELMKRLAKKALPKIDDETARDIEEEIAG
ncbi:MAG: hypothetical protein IH880_05355 [Candidatus Marinimicrobia bacterium]|nr:hypothetical protein [Candidatus Neomarinimicrobiota bacterium]